MSNSKTAEKSKPKKTGGFQASPDVPRFIPLQNGDLLFRNPVTGRNERVKYADQVVRVDQEFGEHSLHEHMAHELAELGPRRVLNDTEALARLIADVKERLIEEEAA